MHTQDSTIRRVHWLLVVALACAPREERAALDDTPSNGDACAVVRRARVPRTLPGDGSETPRVAPFGERFGLIASDSLASTQTVDVAIVSWQGVDELHRFTLAGLCPQGACRNVHGTALLAGAMGLPEFVLAEQGSSVSMAAYPLRALAWSSEGREPLTTPLFDARVGAITTRSDMTSSNDAQRALFVTGNVDTASLQAALLGASGSLVGSPFAVSLPSAPWECLSVVPTQRAAAISVVARAEDGAELTWLVRELTETSELAFETSVVLPVGDTFGYVDCPTVIVSSQGFHAQWVSTEGDSLVATLTREGSAGPKPSIVYLGTNTARLEATLHGDFVFRAPALTGGQRLIRVDREGHHAGTLRTLPPLAAAPRVLSAEETRLSLSYELENERVFEGLECP